MKISNLKRIIREDFAEEDRDLADKLALVLNPFLEQINNAFNKNIDNDNLARQTISIDVENISGNLKQAVQFKHSLGNRRILGFNIIRAENITNSSIYPTEAPWISWTINGDIITVRKVTGIQDNNKYRFTLELIS